MPHRLDIPTRFAAAGIALDADAATLQAELEQRGWRVQVEEPLPNAVGRHGGSSGNRARALAFRAQRTETCRGPQGLEHVGQTGASVEDALRKVLAAVLQRRQG